MSFPVVITPVGFTFTMSFLMSSKRDVTESFSTFTMMIGFLSCMYSGDISCALPDGFSTFIKLVWFFISMDFLIFQHSRVTSESFPTFITFKRCFSTIYSLMTSKGCFLSKGFPIVFTFAEFLTSMNSLMTFKGTLFFLKAFAHPLHLWSFFLEWILWWLIIIACFLRHFPHSIPL